MAVDMFLTLDGVKGESKDKDDRLTENVGLNFAKVTVEYVPQNDKGSPGKSWDIAANDNKI